MSETGETINNRRNFGTEIRDASGDRPEQRRLLRELFMDASGIDEDSARRVLESVNDAGLVIVTEEGWEQGIRAQESLNHINAVADQLFPDK